MGSNKTLKLSWVGVLLLVAALCVGAYFLATNLVNARAPSLRESIMVSASPNQSIAPLGNGMLYLDGGSLHALDARGRQIWSYPAGSYADFNVGDGGVSVWSGTMLSLLNAADGTALYSGNMDGKIVDARLGTVYAAVQWVSGDSAQRALSVVPGLEEHNSTMQILDPGGRQVDKIELPNQTVLDFGFFSDGRLFWVMSLDTEGTTPMCSITTYIPGKMIAGSIPDTQQVLYEAVFQASKIRAVGNTHIKDFDYYGKEITENRMLVYGWYLVDIDERQQNPLMLFIPIDQADGTVSVTDLRLIQGQTDVRIRLPAEAKQVFVRGDSAYAFSSDRVIVCHMSGTDPLIYFLPMQVDNVLALTDNHSAIVTSGASVFMIPLP